MGLQVLMLLCQPLSLHDLLLAN